MLCLAYNFKYNHALKMMHYEGIRLLNPWLINQRGVSCKPSCVRHQIKYKPYVPSYHSDHDHKNMSLKRPMSPHLSIYKPTMPATTSIFQRITGLIVTTYGLLLAGGALFLANGVETYVLMIQSLDLSRASIFIIKMLVGAPFAYHYFNGIRFCAWNAGRWLAKKDITSTAVKSWIATAVMTILFAIL